MSLRQGRFKKHAITTEALPALSQEIYPRLQKLTMLYQDRKISAAEFCALYILLFVKLTRKNLWLGAKIKSGNSPILGFPISQLDKVILDFDQTMFPEMTVMDIIQNYTLRGIPNVVNTTLLQWHHDIIPLILLFKIPKPNEVLWDQMQGKRSVTMITSEAGLSKYVLGERDPLSFLIHDLQHAAKFYSNKDSFIGQLGFYRFIHKLAENEELNLLLSEDAQFRENFEYAISDMNAYSVHLVKHINNSFKEVNKKLGRTDCLWLKYLNQNVHDYKTLEVFLALYQQNQINSQNTLMIQAFFEDLGRIS
ncbi:MAG: hypothetical protein ACOYL6_06315 [Bacteriovoracaceae bacterium]